MAHADIFTKINKDTQKNTRTTRYIEEPKAEAKESQVKDKTLETVKLLAKQVLEMRESLENQAETIAALEETVTSLRKQQNDTGADLKLIFIDQKDMFRQFRLLKAQVESELIVDPRSPSQHTSMQQQQQARIAAQAANPSREQEQNLVQEDSENNFRIEKKTEDLIQDFYPNYNKSTVIANANASESLKKVFEPQKSEALSLLQSKTIEAENIAKDFIFGRMPKLLKLD